MEEEQKSDEQIVKFEVGKFYLIQVYPTFGTAERHPVAAECIRVGKYRVKFRYCHRSSDGTRSFVVVERKYGMCGSRTKEMCWSPELYSGIGMTAADETCQKPSFWDEVVASDKAKNKKTH